MPRVNLAEDRLTVNRFGGEGATKREHTFLARSAIHCTAMALTGGRARKITTKWGKLRKVGSVCRVPPAQWREVSPPGKHTGSPGGVVT